MFFLSRRQPLAYVFLVCTLLRTSPFSEVNAHVIFVESNSSQVGEDKFMAKTILETEMNETLSLEDTPMVSNCSYFDANGANFTSCVNSTSACNGTATNCTLDGKPKKRDRFKFLQTVIPILVKAAVILIRVIKILITIARLLWRLGYQMIRFALRYAARAVRFAIRAGKIVGRYVARAGKIVLEVAPDLADVTQAIVDPVLEYQRQQEEAKKLAAQEEEYLKEDMKRQEQAWKDEAMEVPADVGEEPEWMPQRSPSVFGPEDEEDPDAMPGWLLSMIVITLVALIVAMPTTAFIITNQRQRRRRRRRRRGGGQRRTKKTRKGGKSKLIGTSKKSTSTSKKTQKSISKENPTKADES